MNNKKHRIYTAAVYTIVTNKAAVIAVAIVTVIVTTILFPDFNGADSVRNVFSGNTGIYRTVNAASKVFAQQKGTVSKQSLKVKKKAGGQKNIKMANGAVIQLSKGKTVTVTDKVKIDSTTWYSIKFQYKKTAYQGYVKKSAIALVSESEKRTGYVIATSLNVRSAPGTWKDILESNGRKVRIEYGEKLTVLLEDTSIGELWYYVKTSFYGTTVKGYVSSDYISFIKPDKEETPSDDENNPPDEDDKEPGENEQPDQDNNLPGTIIDNDSSWGIGTGSSIVYEDEEAFEAALEEEGFPESYKPYLRQLHEKYPSWKFHAYQTGLSWDTVIAKEAKIGRNLIPISKNIAWKSVVPGAYNWATDNFTIFDGTTWVCASEDAIRYYMDPRNFLTETGIYQFELLSYNKDIQNVKGVQEILSGTPMEGSKGYSYKNENGKNETLTYTQTFIKAAELSGVSPYHLASRTRQEVVVSSSSFSGSATGKYSGYEGYYNFYNIGANDSAGGGAIANGLTYAKKTDSTYLLPWTSPYRSIVGGALYIGKAYIGKGQDTLYLQKFNVTPNSTYNHQYMTNVEAAFSEGQRIAEAYKSMSGMPIVFSIPVYEDMPEKACAAPQDGKNPNNWLSKLNIKNYSLTPTFQIEDEEDTVYSLIVDNEVDSIKINTQTVSALATVEGDGKQKLEEGENMLTVTVTAENGDTRDYTINVLRKEG